MSDLKQAAQAVLNRWDSPNWEWKHYGSPRFLPTATLMSALRKALAEQQAEPERWCMTANGCKTECGNCPNFPSPQQQAEPSYDEGYKAGWSDAQLKQQTGPVADEWAKLLHYPDCWDTAAYPTLHDAVHEALAWSGCSVCKLAQQAEPTKYTEANLLAYGRAEFARALLLAAAAARPFWVMGDTIALRILRIDGIFEDNAREAKP